MLEIQYIDPRELLANPWNSNHVDLEAEKQLEKSLRRLKMIDPIKVRELDDGSFEILSGQHRTEACIRLNYSEVPIINLGSVPEAKAREISLVSNGRYGRDDPIELMEVIEFIQAEGNVELSSFLPYDEVAVDAAFASRGIDISDVMPDTTDDFEDDTSLPGDELMPPPPKARQVMRFSVDLDDAAQIEKLIERTVKKQKFDESHSMVNAGLALAFLLLGDAS